MAAMAPPLFTVFTPTFNRAHTLGRVYESLRRQSFHDFEWVIIDDGSTDGTRALVESWTHATPFPLRYEFQPNQGKNVAFNHGIRIAHGELFVPLDSDDELVPNALITLRMAWLSCPPGERDRYSGVTGLCLDVQNNVVGTVYPRSPLDSTSLETRLRFKVRGEKSGFIRTAVLREYPFPEFPGMRYSPEAIVWARIGQKYLTRFINDPIRIYHQNTGNQVTTSRPETYAQGHALWHRAVLNEQMDYFRYAPEEYVRSAIHYARFSFHIGERRAMWTELRNPLAKLLVFLTLPISMAVFLRDRLTGARSAPPPQGSKAV